MKTKERNKQIAIIWWFDSAFHGFNQRDESEVKSFGLLNCMSAGIVINEDKEKITICQDIFPKKQKSGQDFSENQLRASS